jgi:hypothetical protein
MTTPCTHWAECDSPDGGVCRLHGAISFGVCRQCPDNTRPGWVEEFLKHHSRCYKRYAGQPCSKSTNPEQLKPY